MSKHLVQVVVFLGSFLILIVVGSIFLSFLFEPTSLPLRVSITNIADKGVSISWITKKPTKGAILISENNQFPSFPLFVKNWQKDDGEKNLKTMNFYTTHHITVGNLKPNTLYYFRIYQGLRNVYQGKMTTVYTLEKISPPFPVYGKVISADEKTPAIGAIVYLQLTDNRGSSSAILSTLTNSEGRWSIDRGNIRTKDFKSIFVNSKDVKEQIIVATGNRESFKAETTSGNDRPWPDIILKVKK